MTFKYPAIFRKQEDGTYKGFFPDLEQCYAVGETLEDAVNDAIAECRAWIQTELEDSFDLPEVSDIEDLELQEGDEVRTIGVIIRLYEGWDE